MLRGVVIDLATESLLVLTEVPQLLPPRRNGKRLHVSACYRWAKVGTKGVVLETIKVGGSTYTSREALQRFADRLSERQVVGPRPGFKRTLAQEREHKAAMARLEIELGFSSRSPTPKQEIGDRLRRPM